MPRRPLPFVLLLSSCGALSLDHTFRIGSDRIDHPWHQLPATAAAYVVAAPLLIVSVPLILLDEMAEWGSIIHETGGPGMSGYFVAGPAIAAGYLVSMPFFVCGLPWEFRSSEEATSQPSPRPADEPQR